MSQPDWKKALPSPPDDGQLLEAWFTTYEQPDAGLLVEHLLPGLLQLDHALTPEPNERNAYFGELGKALERLRGKLTVISSPSRNRNFKNDGEEQTQDQNAGRQSAPYPWLWRYVSHFTVGAKGPAVQHAKFWAFHWETQEGEFLELHVSSTNLTMSAFKGQIQAGWCTCVELQRKNPTKAGQQGWGDLVSFLDALGDSAGENAKERTDRLVQLLGRVDCPNGIVFVASTPGSEKRGAHALRKLRPNAIHILAPTIGDWNHASISDWAKDAGVSPQDIHLKWIDERHPWTCGWTLTEKARDELCKSVQLNRLKAEDRLHDEHVDGDARWSHAKLYLLRLPRKKKRCLLLTSANWSASAWGAGKDKPRNFELGVLFETDWKWLEEGVKDGLPAPFAAARGRTGESRLQWADASWDGERIAIRARSTDTTSPISAEVTFTGGAEESTLLVEGAASVPWSDSDRTPLVARISQGCEVLEVDVLDLRPTYEFAKTPLPEVDPAVQKALREAFLLQRYGGPAVDPEPIPGRGGDRWPAGVSAPATDYAVQAWIESRAAFSVVDKWRAALDEAATEDPRREQVCMDGEELRALFARREDPGALLVAEELGWRLDEEA